MRGNLELEHWKWLLWAQLQGNGRIDNCIFYEQTFRMMKKRKKERLHFIPCIVSLANINSSRFCVYPLTDFLSPTLYSCSFAINHANLIYLFFFTCLFFYFFLSYYLLRSIFMLDARIITPTLTCWKYIWVYVQVVVFFHFLNQVRVLQFFFFFFSVHFLCWLVYFRLCMLTKVLTKDYFKCNNSGNR